MSTYSSLLRFVLQAVGENTNTWGTVLNNGALQLIDDAIAGSATVDLTAGNVTLTAANGATDQARKAILIITGTLSNNQSVVVPTSTKMYVVDNQTTGAFAVTITTVGGTGVTVDQGSSALVFCDGTNVVMVRANLGTNTTPGVFKKAGSSDVTAGTDDTMAITPLALAPTITSFNSSITTLQGEVIVPGICVDYAGTSAPTGYLPCDGSAVSRTTYSALFSAIGTTWGVGDGSTTFNVPDFRRRVTVGSGGTGSSTLGSTVNSTGGEETHTLVIGEMPSHNHPPGGGATYFDVNTGGPSNGAYNVGGANFTVTTTGSTGGGGAHNNIQPSAVVTKCIKY